MQVLFASVLSLAFLGFVCAQDACAIDSSNNCRCTTSNGTELNIAHYFKYPVEAISPNPTQYSYKFSPCKEVSCAAGIEGGTMCQYAFDLDRWFVLGRLSGLSWTIHQYEPLNFTITYSDGEPGPDGTPRALYTITTAGTAVNDLPWLSIKHLVDKEAVKVTFAYSDTLQPTLTFVEEYPQLVYDFEMTGKVVVPYTPSSRGGGGGSGAEVGIIRLVVISLALAGIITYFVIGSVVNFKVKGARGSEVIPNIEFWKDLPFLIKDGCVFTLRPCIDKVRGKSGYERT